MDITDVRIRKVSTGGKLKAYVTVTFDDCFVVHNMKIITGKVRTFVAMPSRKTRSGEYKDVAHPINSDFRHRIQNKIINEYDKFQEELESEAEREEQVSEGFEPDRAQDIPSEPR